MLKRSIGYLLIIFMLVAINIIVQSFYKNIKTVTTAEELYRSYWLKVILLPLDSRPACTQFVERLGAVSGIQVILPPTALLDNYKTPANKNDIRNWLKNEAKNADAAIVSVDMLTHGGLLSSRLSTGSPTDSQAVVDLLKAIHADNNKLKIYAFNIIPRLLLADSKENVIHQKNVFKYSVLKDQVYTFENPLDIEKLVELEEQIPPWVLMRYNDMYQQNVKVNTELAHLVEEGILSYLVIGQDDGYPFGIPNISKKQIQHYVSQLTNKDSIIITRGTDEVALSLLGKIVTDFSGRHPRVFVIYSDEDAPRVTMPYMPNTVATTVREKLALTGCRVTTDISAADYILYVHIGTDKNKGSLPKMADQIKDLIDEGYRVALVDLSENFYGHQTLFPHLNEKNADVTKLLAYAGWNTTSNSVGTAVTQAVVFMDGLKRYHTANDIVKLHQDNLEFLTSRFLDDYYFQKDVQSSINSHLKDRQADPYNLNGIYDQTNRLVNNLMQDRAQTLYYEYLYNRPIVIKTPEGTKQYFITNLKLEAHLPWERTFEIYVKPKLSYGLYQSQ